MSTFTYPNTFSVGGVGIDGATVNAYKASRFSGAPALNASPPSGSVDATTTTGTAAGSHGAFVIALPTSEDYYISVAYSGTTYWLGPVYGVFADGTAEGGAAAAGTIAPAATATPVTGVTASPGDNTTKLATTAFVEAAVAASVSGVSSFNGRTGIVTLSTADVEAVFTAVGQLLLGTGSGTGTTLAPGSTGQVLTIVGGTAAWAASAAAGVSSFNTRTGAITLTAADAEAIFTAAGQLLVATGSGTGKLLTAGTTGQVLTAATGAAPIWSTPPVVSFNTRTGAITLTAGDIEAVFTAAGQMIVGTGVGTGGLLAGGTTGQVLTATTGAAPSWAAPTAGTTAHQFTVFNVKIDYSAAGNGTTDDTTAINNAIAAAVAAGGGIVYLPPGTYKTTAALSAATTVPIHIVGAGWTTIIKPTGTTAFDCIRAYDSTTNSGEGPTNTGFVIRDLLIDGTAMTNSSGTASGIHLGDLFQASVLRVCVQNFSHGANYGLWFDNNYSWAEQLTVDAFVSNNTIGCVFDVASGAGTTSQPFITGSYDRADIKLGINQGTDTFNGLLLRNGSVLLDSRLYVYGNFGANTTTDTAYAIGVVGGTPTGAYIGTMSIITSSFIQVGIEQDTGGSSSGDEPYTVFFGPSITSGGTTYYPQIVHCMGILDFAAANAFKPTNGTANNMSGNSGVCLGDTTLAALW